MGYRIFCKVDEIVIVHFRDNDIKSNQEMFSSGGYRDV